MIDDANEPTPMAEQTRDDPQSPDPVAPGSAHDAHSAAEDASSIRRANVVGPLRALHRQDSLLTGEQRAKLFAKSVSIAALPDTTSAASHESEKGASQGKEPVRERSTSPRRVDRKATAEKKSDAPFQMSGAVARANRLGFK